MSTLEFDELMDMYFAGALDRVQRRAFDRLLAEDADLSARFDEVYDARTDVDGLSALAAVAPDLDECFSHDTLQAFADGRLDDEAAGWVQEHLACPLCRAQVDALVGAASHTAPRLDEPPKVEGEPSRASSPAFKVIEGGQPSRPTTKAASAPDLRAAAGPAAGGAWSRTSSFAVAAAAASVAFAIVGIGLQSTEVPSTRSGMNESAGGATLVLPAHLTVESKDGAVETGETASLRVAPSGKSYFAVAVRPPGGPLRWLRPKRTSSQMSPNLTTPGPDERIDIDASPGTEVWIFFTPQLYNLDTFEPIAAQLRSQESDDSVPVRVTYWRVIDRNR